VADARREARRTASAVVPPWIAARAVINVASLRPACENGPDRALNPQRLWRVDGVRTVGHGTLAKSDFAALVRGAGVEAVVDVRRSPASRRHPPYGLEAMQDWLSACGITYRWLPSLGGRRRPDPGSLNRALRNDQFRAYADHMATAEFDEGIDELLEVACTRRAAVMCAETLWWRCHRRLVADHLVLVDKVAVEHLFPNGRLVPHYAMAEARVEGGHVVYQTGEATGVAPSHLVESAAIRSTSATLRVQPSAIDPERSPR
jgi:Domain of unknown function DUF488